MEGLRDKVRTILSKLKINEAPVAVNRVAELFSVPIINYSYFPQSISGTIVKQNDSSIIGVNDNQAMVRQRFTIAHELGHFLLGHDHDTHIDERFDESNQIERDANKFAAELLMPIDFLKNDIKSGITNVPVLAKRYQVSEQAMAVRLLETSLINEIK
ncbi:MAG TPA: ImmA/IrrE family metallo-endopeptidase [Candidatus Paceibacterota bacterium]|jgi:Zn-dependent peptidase ImmA (M78 family)|nr:ImmA/IrrE family metallo-endopeptidase [Candidatus Paceibacterota bacterium]